MKMRLWAVAVAAALASASSADAPAVLYSDHLNEADGLCYPGGAPVESFVIWSGGALAGSDDVCFPDDDAYAAAAGNFGLPPRAPIANPEIAAKSLFDPGSEKRFGLSSATGVSGSAERGASRFGFAPRRSSGGGGLGSAPGQFRFPTLGDELSVVLSGVNAQTGPAGGGPAGGGSSGGGPSGGGPSGGGPLGGGSTGGSSTGGGSAEGGGADPGAGPGSSGGSGGSTPLGGSITPSNPGQPVAAVPLPPGLALLLTALAGLGVFGRRRRG